MQERDKQSVPLLAPTGALLGAIYKSGGLEGLGPVSARKLASASSSGPSQPSSQATRPIRGAFGRRPSRPTNNPYRPTNNPYRPTNPYPRPTRGSSAHLRRGSSAHFRRRSRPSNQRSATPRGNDLYRKTFAYLIQDGAPAWRENGRPFLTAGPTDSAGRGRNHQRVGKTRARPQTAVARSRRGAGAKYLGTSTRASDLGPLKAQHRRFFDPRAPRQPSQFLFDYFVEKHQLYSQKRGRWVRSRDYSRRQALRYSSQLAKRSKNSSHEARSLTAPADTGDVSALLHLDGPRADSAEGTVYGRLQLKREEKETGDSGSGDGTDKQPIRYRVALGLRIVGLVDDDVDMDKNGETKRQSSHSKDKALYCVELAVKHDGDDYMVVGCTEPQAGVSETNVTFAPLQFAHPFVLGRWTGNDITLRFTVCRVVQHEQQDHMGKALAGAHCSLEPVSAVYTRLRQAVRKTEILFALQPVSVSGDTKPLAAHRQPVLSHGQLVVTSHVTSNLAPDVDDGLLSDKQRQAMSDAAGATKRTSASSSSKNDASGDVDGESKNGQTEFPEALLTMSLHDIQTMLVRNKKLGHWLSEHYNMVRVGDWMALRDSQTNEGSNETSGNQEESSKSSRSSGWVYVPDEDGVSKKAPPNQTNGDDLYSMGLRLRVTVQSIKGDADLEPAVTSETVYMPVLPPAAGLTGTRVLCSEVCDFDSRLAVPVVSPHTLRQALRAQLAVRLRVDVLLECLHKEESDGESKENDADDGVMRSREYCVGSLTAFTYDLTAPAVIIGPTASGLDKGGLALSVGPANVTGSVQDKHGAIWESSDSGPTESAGTVYISGKLRKVGGSGRVRFSSAPHELEVMLSCEALPSLITSKDASDDSGSELKRYYLCALFARDVFLGRTELICDDYNPQFRTKFILEGRTHQEIQVNVYELTSTSGDAGTLEDKVDESKRVGSICLTVGQLLEGERELPVRRDESSKNQQFVEIQKAYPLRHGRKPALDEMLEDRDSHLTIWCRRMFGDGELPPDPYETAARLAEEKRQTQLETREREREEASSGSRQMTRKGGNMPEYDANKTVFSARCMNLVVRAGPSESAHSHGSARRAHPNPVVGLYLKQDFVQGDPRKTGGSDGPDQEFPQVEDLVLIASTERVTRSRNPEFVNRFVIEATGDSQGKDGGAQLFLRVCDTNLRVDSYLIGGASVALNMIKRLCRQRRGQGKYAPEHDSEFTISIPLSHPDADRSREVRRMGCTLELTVM